MIMVALLRQSFDSLLNTRQTFQDYRSFNELAQGLQADVDARTHELSTLHEVAADLSNTLDSSKIIATALERSMNSLHAEAGALWLFKGEEEAETTLALTGTAGQDGIDTSTEERIERRKAQRKGGALESRQCAQQCIGDSQSIGGGRSGTSLSRRPRRLDAQRWALAFGARPGEAISDDASNRQGELQRNAIKALHDGLEQGNLENAQLTCRSLGNNFQAAAVVPIQWKGEMLGAIGILRTTKATERCRNRFVAIAGLRSRRRTAKRASLSGSRAPCRPRQP